jgi:hypothetical protein
MKYFVILSSLLVILAGIAAGFDRVVVLEEAYQED